MIQKESRISRRTFLEGIALLSGQLALTSAGLIGLSELYGKTLGADRFWADLVESQPKNELTELLRTCLQNEPFRNPTSMKIIALNSGVLEMLYLNLERPSRTETGSYQSFTALPMTFKQTLQYADLIRGVQTQFIQNIDLDQALILLTDQLSRYSPQLLHTNIGVLVNADDFDTNAFIDADPVLQNVTKRAEAAMNEFVQKDLFMTYQNLGTLLEKSVAQKSSVVQNLSIDELSAMKTRLETTIKELADKSGKLNINASMSIRLDQSTQQVSLGQSTLKFSTSTDIIGLKLHTMEVLPYVSGFSKYELLNTDEVSQLLWGFQFNENLGLDPTSPEAQKAMAAVTDLETAFSAKMN